MVKHVITKRVIEVTCVVSLFEGVVAYAEDKEGWDLDLLSLPGKTGKKLFLKRVKQYEEKRRENKK